MDAFALKNFISLLMQCIPHDSTGKSGIVSKTKKNKKHAFTSLQTPKTQIAVLLPLHRIFFWVHKAINFGLVCTLDVSPDGHYNDPRV